MIIGFTGTSKEAGMTLRQKQGVEYLLHTLKKQITAVVHGDCIGADAQFQRIAESLKLPTMARPANLPGKRAYCKTDILFPPLPPLVRNKQIVDESDILIAAPKSLKEELRSGTWATIRYARKKGVPIYIYFPDGIIGR